MPAPLASGEAGMVEVGEAHPRRGAEQQRRQRQPDDEAVQRVGRRRGREARGPRQIADADQREDGQHGVDDGIHGGGLDPCGGEGRRNPAKPGPNHPRRRGLTPRLAQDRARASASRDNDGTAGSSRTDHRRARAGDLMVRLKAGTMPLAGALASRDLSGLQADRDTIAPPDGASPAWWDADSRGLALRGADLAGGRLAGAQLRAPICAAPTFGRHRPVGRPVEAVLEQVRFIGPTWAALLRGGQRRRSRFHRRHAGGRAVSPAPTCATPPSPGRCSTAPTFHGADLWGVRATKAEADDASFRGARCDEADFTGADLTGADLTGASLKKAKFGGAKLRGAKFDGAMMDGAHFDGADLATPACRA